MGGKIELEAGEVLAFASAFIYHYGDARAADCQAYWDEQEPWNDNVPKINQPAFEHLLSVLPWDEAHCEEIDRYAEAYRPDTLKLSEKCAKEMAAYCGSAHKLVFRLGVFEYTLDPSRADVSKIMNAVEQYLLKASGPVEHLRAQPEHIGRFLCGPLGIIIKPHAEVSGAVQAESDLKSFYDVAQSLYHSSQGECFLDAPLSLHPDWTPEQVALHHQETTNNYEEKSTIAFTREVWMTNPRSSESSPPLDQKFKHWLGMRAYMGNGFVIGDLLSSFLQRSPWEDDLDYLRELLNLAAKPNYYREAFNTTGADWSYADEKRFRKILSKPSKDTSSSEIKQLLQLISPEQVLCCANGLADSWPLEKGRGRAFGVDRPFVESNERVMPGWADSQPFSVSLARAMLLVYHRTNKWDEFTTMVGKSGGDKFEQALHYVIQQGPKQVLQAELMKVYLAPHYAALTFAHPKFDPDGRWDFSDPHLRDELFKNVALSLNYCPVPEIVSSARPAKESKVRRIIRNGTSSEIKDAITRFRRRTEWLLKTMLTWSVSISDKHREDTDEGKDHGSFSHETVPKIEPFYLDYQFRHQVEDAKIQIDTSGTKQTPRYLTCPEEGRVTLQPLCGLLGNLEHIFPKGEFTQSLEVLFREHAMLLKLLENNLIMKHGNLGSHDNNASHEELCTALQTLLDFDLEVRDDLIGKEFKFSYPKFITFAREERKPEEPRIVDFRILHQDDEDDEDQAIQRYYFTQSFEFKPGRIYAAFDLTRNSISLNPIIFDWTDYLSN